VASLLKPLQEVKQRRPELQVILMSAADERQRALVLGADDYLAKPVALEQLIGTGEALAAPPQRFGANCSPLRIAATPRHCQPPVVPEDQS